MEPVSNTQTELIGYQSVLSVPTHAISWSELGAISRAFQRQIY